MTEAQTVSGGAFLALIGDGASPEVFVAPCGLNSRGFNQTKAVNDTIVPDCSNPDAATWVQRDAASFSGVVSGAGVVDTTSLATWQAFFASSASKNVKLQMGTVGHWLGKFHCTKLDVTGENKKRVMITIELQSDGAAVWTSGS